MKKYSLHHPIYSLLLVLIFITSCNGQNKTQSQTDSVSEPKTIPIGQSKIKKPQGKPDDNVHCGLQDKAGNLWFGTTWEGVYRYDGKLFTNFTEKDGLSNNTVWSILEDKTGNIWFGTGDGICRYDGKTFTSIPIAVTNGSNFLPYTLPNNNPSAKNTVWSILQDKTGKLWFGTSDGVYCYNGTFFTHFLDNDSIVNKNGLHLKLIYSILEDKNGNIWFGSGLGEGICRFDGKSLTSFTPNVDGRVNSILEDKNGNLWFGTGYHGLCRYDGKTFTNFTEKAGLNIWVTSILEDKTGNLWFGTSGEGVYRYDGKSFTNFTEKDGLSNNTVYSIVEDSARNIWMGARNSGLCRYDGKTFTNFTE